MTGIDPATKGRVTAAGRDPTGRSANELTGWRDVTVGRVPFLQLLPTSTAAREPHAAARPGVSSPCRQAHRVSHGSDGSAVSIEPRVSSWPCSEGSTESASATWGASCSTSSESTPHELRAPVPALAARRRSRHARRRGPPPSCTSRFARRVPPPARRGASPRGSAAAWSDGARAAASRTRGGSRDAAPEQVSPGRLQRLRREPVDEAVDADSGDLLPLPLRSACPGEQ